jgi:CBS domain-containing protein
MLASELMINSFPVLHPEDEVQKAIDIFLDTSIGHIPVLDTNGILEGIFPAGLLINQAVKDDKLIDYRDDWIQAYVYPEQHGLMVFEVLARLELTAVPVINEQRNYIGLITTQEVLTRLSNLYSFKEPGGIILLTVGTHDYDLTEIARIVESNNAKVLMLYMGIDEESEFFKITLKVSTIELSHIIPTFERFKYTVDYYFPNTLQRDELRERYDLVMKLFDL